MTAIEISDAEGPAVEEFAGKLFMAASAPWSWPTSSWASGSGSTRRWQEPGR